MYILANPTQLHGVILQPIFTWSGGMNINHIQIHRNLTMARGCLNILLGKDMDTAIPFIG
jgi:hypothetical protein